LNILLTSIGRRGYIVDFFRQALSGGDRLVVANSVPDPPGAEAADASYTIPPASDPSFAAALLKLAEEEEIDLLFSLHDWEAPAIAAIKSDLAAIGTRAVVPDLDTALICLDKFRTFSWAEKHGIRTPRSWISRDQALAGGQFPFIVKPRFGQGSVGLFKVDSKAELDAALLLAAKTAQSFPRIEGIPQDAAPLLISEWIEGIEIGIDVVNDFEGAYSGLLANKKLVSRNGETEVTTTLDPHPFEPIAKQISSALGHPSICDCDLIEREGEYYLIELNPRFGGLYPFAHHAGADVPSFLVRLQDGHRAPDLLRYRHNETFIKHFSFSK